MLHEIILALHGCLSSILYKNFEAIELPKVLHPSEKALLKRILQIGETYGNIVVFIDKNICPTIDLDTTDIGNDESNAVENGMYLQAFCDGLQKVLHPYRKDIVKLEKLALRDPYLSLTSINSYIGRYTQLLYTLHSMITEIKEDRIHGCKLLQFVCRHLCTGVESMREALSEIANSCHLVLINQLTNWLLCGQLMDHYNEFFIRPKKAMLSSSGANGSAGSNVNENVVNDPNVNLSFVDVQNDGSEFCLDPDFLPPYISYVTANKILYIGKTVVLFKSDLQKGKSGSTSHLDVYNQEELKLIKSLRVCSFQDCQSLESVIVELESSVAKRLWLLAVEQADLMGQLKATKEFYLLGRGEMFVDFLNKIGSTLNKHISSNITRDLNIALLASARNIQYPYESTLEKFVFKLPPKDSSNQAKVKSVLRLEYSAMLPLHLFFSPIVIDNYNVLFRFFLRVKQAQLNLHGVWLKGVKNKSQLLTDRSWQLRNHLMFLVENLQCYLQWDVVESEHTALLNEIKKFQDFEKIRHLHHNFLFNVLSQSFLIPNDAKLDQNTGLLLISSVPQNMKPHAAHVFLGHILDLSETFCLLVTKRENADISDELETMSEKLSHCVRVLVKLITNLRNQLSGVHLTKLLLRLDFNHYFSHSQAAAAFVSKSTS